MRRALLATATALLAAAALLSACGPVTDTADGRPAVSTTHPTPAPVPSPADVATIAARAAHIPVLCYHQVRDWTSQDGPSARSLTTPPAVFAQQMDVLVREGYTSISPAELYTHLAYGTYLPQKPVLITFDDAARGQWNSAVPVLRERGLTATFFVMTIVLDKKGGWLSSDEVRNLDAMGMTIGGHTWDHHPVTGYTDADWSTQVGASQATLEKIVGHPIRWFAYPYGSWDPKAFPHLDAAGVTMAFQLADQLDPSDPLMTVRRVMPQPTWSMSTFSRHLTADF